MYLLIWTTLWANIHVLRAQENVIDKATEEPPRRATFLNPIPEEPVVKDLNYYMEDDDAMNERTWKDPHQEDTKAYAPTCLEDLERADAFDARGDLRPIDHIRRHVSQLNE